jgi:hypothetical protein
VKYSLWERLVFRVTGRWSWGVVERRLAEYERLRSAALGGDGNKVTASHTASGDTKEG